MNSFISNLFADVHFWICEVWIVCLKSEFDLPLGWVQQILSIFVKIVFEREKKKKNWFSSMCLLLEIGCIQCGKSEINKSLLCRFLNCLLMIATQREVILKAVSLNSRCDCFRFLCSPCQTIFHNLNHNKMQQKMEHASAGARKYCSLAFGRILILTGSPDLTTNVFLFDFRQISLH